MTVTVLKLSDADAYLKNISIRSIKDVRALDVDLMLVLVNGDRIIISSGAVSAMSAPESSLQFADGQLPLASVFQQIDKIDVSPEANLTVSSKEITRYNQNNARNKKARKNDEEDSDKPVVVEDGERDPSAAAETSGSSGNTERPNFSPTRSPDNQSQIADAEINSQHEKNWGVQWPIAAGALALLAAAGGGGGGGGSGGGNGGSAANGGSGGAGSGAGAAAAGSAGAGTVDPSAAVIRGNAALGAIKNANVTAYDAAGNAISDTVAVVDGKYTLTLTPGSSTPPQLVLSKTDGSSFTGAQVKAVLEGLQFKTTSRDTSARLIDITLTDQAGNTSTPAGARVELDVTAPPALTMRLTDPNQVIYDVLSMKNIFGTTNPRVLDKADSENFVIPYTDGSTATDFLSRIKGISAAWGGEGIASGANNLTETTQSYLGFNLPPVNNTAFAFSHQGGSYTKSATLKFIVKTIGGVEKLVLSNKGSTFFAAQDIYNSAITTAENDDGRYALGNINLLYALPTTQPERRKSRRL